MSVDNSDLSKWFISEILRLKDEAMQEVLHRLRHGPIGRAPSQELLAQHEWYLALSPTSQPIVEQMLDDAIASYIFRWLCLLDGVKGHYLWGEHTAEFALFLQIYASQLGSEPRERITQMRINTQDPYAFLHDQFLDAQATREQLTNTIYQFTLQHEHFQFYLADPAKLAETDRLWTDDALQQMVAYSDGLIGILTARYGGTVQVEVEVVANKPSEFGDGWEHVIESAISLTSSLVVLTAPELPLADIVHIPVASGRYGVYICFANYSQVDDDFATSGPDRYRIIMWQDEQAPAIVRTHR